MAYTSIILLLILKPEGIDYYNSFQCFHSPIQNPPYIFIILYFYIVIQKLLTLNKKIKNVKIFVVNGVIKIKKATGHLVTSNKIKTRLI